MGAAAQAGQRYAEAESELDAAIDLDPKLQRAWSARAVARAWQGDMQARGDAEMSDSLGAPDMVAQEAAQDHRDAAVRQADAADADTPELRLRRARLYAGLDLKAKALADLDAALAGRPTADAYLLLARLRGADTPGGKADVAAAEALNPPDLSVQLRRINAQLASGDYAVLCRRWTA